MINVRNRLVECILNPRVDGIDDSVIANSVNSRRDSWVLRRRRFSDSSVIFSIACK